MASRLLKDSANSHQMFNSEVEQHERHWFVRLVVVGYKMVLGCLLKFLLIQDFLIRSVWQTKCCHDISEGETSELVKCFNFAVLVIIQMREDSVKAGTEWSPSALFDSVEHPHSICVVDQSITEDSDSLMSPQSQALVACLQLFFARTSHTTNDFRNIS